MINYDGTKELFFTMQGSVLPFAALFAIPAAVVAATLKFTDQVYWHGLLESLHSSAHAYTGFSGLLGFLIIFRTSQAYQRYWDGGTLLQNMIGAWFDSASCCVAFSRLTKKGGEEVQEFRQTIVRLFSLMFSMALLELEDPKKLYSGKYDPMMEKLEVLDLQSMDSNAREFLFAQERRVEVVFHWIQATFIDAIGSGVLNTPPPIAGQVLQNLGRGLSFLEDCKKIGLLPFPFPYSQATVWLLVIHWMVTPVVVCTWTPRPLVAASYTFLMVAIMWSLYKIAAELENPFGDDANDLDTENFQREFNKRLMLIVSDEIQDPVKLQPDYKTKQPKPELLSKGVIISDHPRLLIGDSGSETEDGTELGMNVRTELLSEEGKHGSMVPQRAYQAVVEPPSRSRMGLEHLGVARLHDSPLSPGGEGPEPQQNAAGTFDASTTWQQQQQQQHEQLSPCRLVGTWQPLCGSESTAEGRGARGLIAAGGRCGAGHTGGGAWPVGPSQGFEDPERGSEPAEECRAAAAVVPPFQGPPAASTWWAGCGATVAGSGSGARQWSSSASPPWAGFGGSVCASTC